MEYLDSSREEDVPFDDLVMDMQGAQSLGALGGMGTGLIYSSAMKDPLKYFTTAFKGVKAEGSDDLLVDARLE